MNILYIADKESVLANDRYEVLKKSINPDYIKFVGFVKDRNFFIKLFKNIYLFIKLACFIKIKKIDIVIHLGAYHFILNFLSYLDTSTIVIPQGSEINQLYKGRVKNFIDILFNNSKLITARSEGMKKRILDIYPLANNKVRLLNWGIKDEFFLSDFTNNKKENITIISYRATGKIYNIDIIFDAIKKLKEEHGNIKFIYVEYNKSFDYNLDLSICDEIYSGLSSTELATLLHKCDISISLPSYDGFATSLLETMAAGTLPVISDIEAYKYDFNEYDWLLVKSQINVDKLFEKINRIIIDVDLLYDKKKSRVEYIKKYYSREEQIKNLENIISFAYEKNKE